MAYHPYFATRLIKEGGIFYWEENDREPVIAEQAIEEEVVCGDRSNHYFPWSIVYEESYLHLSCAHHLTDARGSMAFIAAIMEYYARYLRGDKSKIEEETTREQRLAGEMALISEVVYRKGAEALYLPKKVSASPLRPETLGMKSNMKRLSLDIKDLRRVSFGFDASPFALISLLLARACVPYMEGENKIVDLLVSQDLRKFFGAQSLHNFSTGNHFYYYDDKMRNMSAEQVCTIFRGRLDLLSDISNVEAAYSALYEVAGQFHIPEVRAQLKASLAASVFAGTTMAYSHVGKPGMSALASEYISDMYIEGSADPSLITCFGLNYEDRANITISTRFLGNGFIDQIYKQLEELQVGYSLKEVRSGGDRHFVYSEDLDG